MTDRIIATLADVLHIDAHTIGEDDSYETLPRWDSLRRIMLANLIERNFSVVLRTEEIGELTSVAKIRQVLHRHESRAEIVDPSQKSRSAEIFETAAMLADSAFQEAWRGPIVRVALVASLTPDFVAAAIATSVWGTGVLPVLYVAPFGTYVQELVDQTSGLYRFRPDIVVLFPDARIDLPRIAPDEPDSGISGIVEQIVADNQAHWQRLTALGADIIQHLYVPPLEATRGLAERKLPSAPRSLVDTLNDRLMAVAGNAIAWVETDRLAALHGLTSWLSPSYFFNAKLPFDPRFLPEYEQAFGGVWRALRGQTRKVLVLDLDNTLWGGVIGDDGIDGIVLGPDTPRGEAFTAWGHYVRTLAQRGVILAVCSKNSRHLALSGFEHAHSPLKAGDFAAMEISWDDKATGLRRIARTLNVGIDSLVFVDDNPFECELVRQHVPEVAVVELGTEPEHFPARLDAGHWFDLQVLTPEDLKRASSYRARAAAMDEQRVAIDIGSYLDGLAMVGQLYPSSDKDIVRLAQMEQKTNQFNLTTRRLTSDQIQACRADPDGIVLSFTLTDRHADHGLVGSMIGRIDGDALVVDSWLMSCRIFSRTAEHFILRELMTVVKARGVDRIIAPYVPTAKNGILKDVLDGLGFIEQDGLWVRSIDPSTIETHVHVHGGVATVVASGGPLQDAAMASDAIVARIHHLVASGSLDEAYDDLAAATARSPNDIRLAILDAQIAGRRRGWSVAALAWQAAEKQFRDVLELYLPLIDALRDANQHEEMDRVVDAGILRFPTNRDLRHRRAIGALVRGRIEAAATYWHDAHQVDPDWEHPVTGIIEALTQLGRLDDAAAFLRENRRKITNAPLRGLLEAELSVARGLLEPVPALLADLRSEAADNLGLMVRVSNLYSTMRMPDLALDALDGAQAAGGDRATTEFYRALLLRTHERWRLSLEAARNAADAGLTNAAMFDVARQARIHLPVVARQSLVIYGSCQAGAISSIATDILSLDEDIDVILVLGHDDSYYSAIDREKLSRATLFWEQSDDREIVPMRDALREALPPGCRRLTFPALTLFSLWPFDAPEPFRNASEPTHNLGRFPYGDSVALKVAAEGLTGQDGLARYHELSRKLMPNLDNLLGRDLDLIRARDTRSDFSMAMFIEQNVAKLHMFASWGHAFLPAARELSAKLFALSKDQIALDEGRIQRGLDAITPWNDDFQVPIHPLVIEHFRLKFLDAQSRYPWQGQSWTHDEYISNYIDMTTNW